MIYIDEEIELPPLATRKPARNESWYSLWSSVCNTQPLTTKEVRVLLRGHENRQILSPTQSVSGKYESLAPGRLLQILDVPSEMAIRLYGADMDSDPHGSGHMHTGLRHCLACLMLGYHSPVFQHLSIERCPVHGVPLRSTCEACNFVLNLTWKSAAITPFGCPRCGHVFMSGAQPPQREDEIRFIDATLGEKREVITRHLRTSWRVRPCVGPAGQTGSGRAPSTAVRYVRRQSIWTTQPEEDWTVFRGESLRIWEMKERSAGLNFPRSVDQAIRETLCQIRALNREEEEGDLLRMEEMLSRCEASRHWVGPAGVVPCAILKTAYALGAVAGVRALPPLHPRKKMEENERLELVGQMGAPLRPFAVANALLVGYEVLGLFCLNVWRIAHLRELTDIIWHEVPNAADFRPEWCLDDREEVPLLHVRPRATSDTARFLARRYAGRMLQ
ncbi:hypothetical protein AB4Y42_20265 [Paraburkholderia sp. EG286B]|uniref:hypothetical protein n=1 Tax=Paraburkholderia sp. EG286B TaxID=3237011 RepID=UPI0034D2349F